MNIRRYRKLSGDKCDGQFNNELKSFDLKNICIKLNEILNKKVFISNLLNLPKYFYL